MICQRLKLGLSSLDFVQIYGIPFENVCELNKFKRISKMMLVEPAKVFKGSKTFWKDFKIKADFLTPINQT
jgi:hypothetical protein